MGDLVHTERSEPQASRQPQRWYRVTLYTREGGGYVLSVQFVSTHELERSGNWVITAPEPQAFAKAIALWQVGHDPDRLLIGFPAGAQFDRKRNTIAARLKAGIADMLERTLAQVPGATEEL